MGECFSVRAVDILNDAAVLVDGDRADKHGDMPTSMGNIARLWNAYLLSTNRVGFNQTDVAQMLALMKIARTLSGEVNEDDYTDAAGYIGIAAEVRDS